ncbi:MAG: FAD:protein FMN transferase [Phaeodactylibacter sp.]|nr:FAD:protein FMN transferase [Phaeodactylibacter sp.]MCB9048501.1 FAD:protein FMN transferase [Lewinellaceae bacterium]
MNRKLFSGILALCINLLFLNVQELRMSMAALSTNQPDNLARYAFQHPQMGTLFKILMYAEDSLQASAAAHAAFARIDTLNAMLSDYREDSELSRLSARAGDGEWIAVSEELWLLLGQSIQMAILTDGAFDPTIGPLSKLWRKAFRQGSFPDTAALRIAKEKVGYCHLQFHHTQQLVRLRRPGMRLDLGGIAKGYAVDAAMAVLRECSIPAALVDGGGDLLAGDPPPDKTGWRVAIGKDTVLTISRQAVATSGDSYRYLEWQGQRYSHIIDPRTGLGVSHGRQATVMATDCTTADALASALSVEPALKNRIKRIFPGAEAIIRE